MTTEWDKDVKNLLRGVDGYGSILADPPWRFNNRGGKVSPEHKRLYRYPTMPLQEIKEMPIAQLALSKCHLYLWVPSAIIQHGLDVLRAWGFEYKTLLVWHKIRKDGLTHHGGVGFYFRNAAELVLFGVKGNLRTLSPGRSLPNVFTARPRQHSRKPPILYKIIEDCSPPPYLELFARQRRKNWIAWGDETDKFSPHIQDNPVAFAQLPLDLPSQSTK